MTTIRVYECGGCDHEIRIPRYQITSDSTQEWCPSCGFSRYEFQREYEKGE